MTTTLDIETFFNKVFENEKETAKQLMRRCKTHVRFEKENIYISMWNSDSNAYSKEYKIPNPILIKHKSKDLSQDEILSRLSKMFGVSKEMIDDFRKDSNGFKQEELKEIKK
jgi:hypothetical protein